MLTITAIIRVKKGHETVMRQALLEVASNVRANEPTTIGYYISQDARIRAYSRHTSASSIGGDGSTQ